MTIIVPKGVMIVDYKLGKMIDHFRKARGMTMDELGETLDKTASTVSRWINESRSPKVEDLIKLTELFNTDINTLLYGDDVLMKNKYYRFYADDILSLNIEHFFNLDEEPFLRAPLPDFIMHNINGNEYIITKLYSDSVDQIIPRGSCIGIDTEYKNLSDGDIVLCYYQNTLKVRVHYGSKKDPNVILKTAMKNSPNTTDKLLKKDVLILGKIISAFISFSN